MIQNATCMNMSLAVRLSRKMHLSRSSSNASCLPSALKCYKPLQFCSVLTRCTILLNGIGTSKSVLRMLRFEHVDFQMCFTPQRRAFLSTSQLPKMLRSCFFLYILAWESAHNGVHIFITSTSKGGLKIWCF